nr:hypothetical protein [Thioflexithrix psekupsensis]
MKCGNGYTSCSATLADNSNQINLTATPASADFKHTGWGDSCSKMPCDLAVGKNTVITPTFEQVPPVLNPSLQIIPSDKGIVSGVVGSSVVHCGHGDNVLGQNCTINFSTNTIPLFGLIKAISKAEYSFVEWSDSSICPNIPIFSESYNNTFQIGENNEQKI